MMKRILPILLLLLVACTPKDNDSPKHVIFIGIDGFSAACFQSADLPFINSLKEEASWTLNKRCTFPTASAINWFTIFSGVPTEYHGYVRWNSRRPDITPAWTDERGEVPTIFHLTREAHPESDILVTFQWDVIRSIVDSTALTTCKQFPQNWDGDIEEAEWAAEYIKTNKPLFSLIYFGSLDHTGHEFGWESDEYMAYANHLDGVVKTIVESVREAGMEDDTVFIFTSDHGGHGKHHSSEYVDETVQTPFFIWGKGIRKGNSIEQAPLHIDITQTLAKLLGVDPLPHWRGRVIEEAFE